MILRSLDIPEASDALAGWLESQLAGTQLRALVLELELFHDAPPASGERLEDLLEDWLVPILRHGLRQVPPPLLGELLRRPRVLLDLQTRIVQQGGPCWQRCAEANPEVQTLLQRSRDQLLPTLTREVPPVPPPLPSAEDEPVVAAPLSAINRAAAVPWLIAGLAVVALLVVLLWQALREPGGAWGWNRPEILEEATATVYFTRLADAADEWFRQRPTEAVPLAQRLQELRLGCTRLLLASHRSLPEPERQWLREQSRLWARQLDQHLEQLEEGQVEQARVAATATVRAILATLREKAKG